MNKRVRVGNLLTGKGFIATFIFTVFFQLLTEPVMFELPPLLLLAVLAFSQLGLFISLLGFQTIRARAMSALAAIASGRLSWLQRRFDISAMALAGLVSTLVAQSALNSLGHLPSSDFLGALGGALVTSAVLLPLMAVGLGLNHDFKLVKAEISKTWGQMELLQARDLGPSLQQTEPTFRGVAARVVERLTALRLRDAQDLNDQLHSLIAQTVQPLIRDLAQAPGTRSILQPVKPSHSSLGKGLAAANGLRLVDSPEWAVMPALLLLPFYLELHGWLGGFVYFLVAAGLCFGLSVALKLNLPKLAKLPIWPQRLVAVGFSGLIAISAIATEGILNSPGAFTLAWQLLGLLWLQLLLAEIFSLLEDDYSQRLHAATELRHELAWRLADVNTREWFVRKLFTRNLPGLAKGELASQIFRVQKSSQFNLEKSELESLVTQLEYRTKHLLALPDHVTDIRREIDTAIEAWRAKASIKFGMDFETAARLGQDPVATLATVEVIREVVGMAVHLAKASSVDVLASLAGDRELELRLSCQQDFLKPGEHFDSTVLASPTRFVRDCTLGFDFEPEVARAIIRLRVPIRPSAAN